MQVNEELIKKLGSKINTEKSRKDYTYVPLFDIKKSIEAFLDWLKENRYKIIKE